MARSSAASSSPQPAVHGRRLDGRSARRERGRTAVVEAVIDLLLEGHAPPSTALVTERAGVSEATLFRYFETIDELQFASATRFLERNSALFAIAAIGTGGLSERIEAFATARANLWETIAPVVRLGRARSFDHPLMADVLRSARLHQTEQVSQHFAPELKGLKPAARDDVVASIVTLTAFEAWDFNSQDLRRSQTQIKRAWRSALRAMLPALDQKES